MWWCEYAWCGGGEDRALVCASWEVTGLGTSSPYWHQWVMLALRGGTGHPSPPLGARPHCGDTEHPSPLR